MDKTVLDAEKNEASQATAWSVFSELVKLRLTTMVLITTLVGFYAGLDAESGGLAQNLAKLGVTLLLHQLRVHLRFRLQCSEKRRNR